VPLQSKPWHDRSSAPTNLTAKLFAATVLTLGWTSPIGLSQLSGAAITDNVNFSAPVTVPATQRTTNGSLSLGRRPYCLPRATQKCSGFHLFGRGQQHDPRPLRASTSILLRAQVTRLEILSPHPAGIRSRHRPALRRSRNGFTYGWYRSDVPVDITATDGIAGSQPRLTCATTRSCT